MLIILDGWGHGMDRERSAIAKASTPTIDQLYRTYPNAELVTYGTKVGLPAGQMGNSEVGHLNIGAGRVVYQDFARINKAIEDGSLAQNPQLLNLARYANERQKPIHLMGLVSEGGVHSHVNHLLALLDILHDKGCQRVYVHAFTDGRDTDPHSGLSQLQKVQSKCEKTGYKLVSVIGRFYAMDRDMRMSRTAKAYDLLVNGIGEHSEDLLESVKVRYENGITDEFMDPIILTEQGSVLGRIQEDDAVLFFNFRTDRPRQLTMVLSQKSFPDEGMASMKLQYYTMTAYDHSFENVHALFIKEDIQQTLGEQLSSHGLTQLRMAETEKYPHVTYFFNGGREEPFDGEQRVMVPSPKVRTYDLKPEMSAPELTSSCIRAMNENRPDFLCINFANPDMVGHTGVFSAAVQAVEAVDKCVSRILKEALNMDYAVMIIADHGNSDMMINEDGSPHTAHTTNMVPVIVINSEQEHVEDGILADIAPTILDIMGIAKPILMTGKSLLS